MNVYKKNIIESKLKIIKYKNNIVMLKVLLKELTHIEAHDGIWPQPDCNGQRENN